MFAAILSRVHVSAERRKYRCVVYRIFVSKMGESDSEVVVFELKKWCDSYELDSSTISVLETEKLTSVAALKTLSREDVVSLDLPLGQRNLLVKACKAISCPSQSVIAAASVDDKATTRSLSRDNELNELVKSLQNTSLTDFLSMEDAEKGGRQMPQGSGLKPKPKVLLIPDFVSKPKGVVDDEEDLFNFSSTGLQTQGQAHLVLRSKSKPKADQVSLPMWVSANARILRQLVDEETDVSQLRLLLKAYLDYTAQIGDLCQSYSVQSVMLLDDSHRREQAKEGKQWDDVGIHAMFYYLDKRQIPMKEATSARTRQRSQRAVDATGREICISYNNPAGCKYPNCRHSHVCIAAGCNERHPVTQHAQQAPAEEGPPRFRRQ